MQTKDDVRQSLETRLRELERRMDEIAARAAHASTDERARLSAQLKSLRTRLDGVRTRLREKDDADNRASDAALAQLGHAINDMYEEVQPLPK